MRTSSICQICSSSSEPNGAKLLSVKGSPKTVRHSTVRSWSAQTHPPTYSKKERCHQTLENHLAKAGT